MSVLERYEGQVNHKGWGRLVVTEHHNQTYEGMPRTIDYIEENDRYDILWEEEQYLLESELSSILEYVQLP